MTTQSDLNLNIGLLKKMGIDVSGLLKPAAARKVIPPKAAPVLDSYNLLITSKCKLCGTSFEDGFEMSVCPITNSRQSKRIALPIQGLHRRETRSVNKCRFCQSELHRFSKEELIFKLLERVRL